MSGDATDYMYELLNVKFSYTTEGRDEPGGQYGYLLPVEQIRPSGEENWATLVELCKYVLRQVLWV